jgi:hypothetical protein
MTQGSEMQRILVSSLSYLFETNKHNHFKLAYLLLKLLVLREYFQQVWIEYIFLSFLWLLQVLSIFSNGPCEDQALKQDAWSIFEWFFTTFIELMTFSDV